LTTANAAIQRIRHRALMRRYIKLLFVSFLVVIGLYLTV